MFSAVAEFLGLTPPTQHRSPGICDAIRRKAKDDYKDPFRHFTVVHSDKLIINIEIPIQYNIN